MHNSRPDPYLVADLYTGAAKTSWQDRPSDYTLIVAAWWGVLIW
jgi:hypothetical protein